MESDLHYIGRLQAKNKNAIIIIMKKNIIKNASTMQKINLNADLMKKLNSMELKEISPLQERNDFIYHYPENWGKNEISGLQGKNFRGGLRRKLMNITHLICIYAKMKKTEDLQAKIKEFNSFYKEFYKINNYEIASISQKKNGEDLEKISLAMQIIKSFPNLMIGKEKEIASKGNKNASKGINKGIAGNKKKIASKGIKKGNAIKEDEIKKDEIIEEIAK